MTETPQAIPYMLTRRSTRETRAYREGVRDGITVCLDIMQATPDNAREKILTLLQLHKPTPQVDAETP